MHACAGITVWVEKGFWRSPAPATPKQTQTTPDCSGQRPLRGLISPGMEIPQPLWAPVPLFDHPHH